MSGCRYNVMSGFVIRYGRYSLCRDARGGEGRNTLFIIGEWWGVVIFVKK